MSGSPASARPEALPAAVPEIPVRDMARALDYYEHRLGFQVDWGREGGGIAGLSQGNSRLFLTDAELRAYFGNAPPVVVWFNLDSVAAVDALHAAWRDRGAQVLHPPESKPWSRLHEFVVTDPDGNQLRIFHNF